MPDTPDYTLGGFLRRMSHLPEFLKFSPGEIGAYQSPTRELNLKAAAPKNEIPPAMIRQKEVAKLLGWSVATFVRRREDLVKAGFPMPRPPFPKQWHKPSIEAWLAARHGNDTGRSDEDILIARAASWFGG